MGGGISKAGDDQLMTGRRYPPNAPAVESGPVASRDVPVFQLLAAPSAMAGEGGRAVATGATASKFLGRRAGAYYLAPGTSD